MFGKGMQGDVEIEVSKLTNVANELGRRLGSRQYQGNNMASSLSTCLGAWIVFSANRILMTSLNVQAQSGELDYKPHEMQSKERDATS